MQPEIDNIIKRCHACVFFENLSKVVYTVVVGISKIFNGKFLVIVVVNEADGCIDFVVVAIWLKSGRIHTVVTYQLMDKCFEEMRDNALVRLFLF